MKRIWIVVAVLGLTASLGAQSLADLAKREKARREGLARHAVVIKNQDLLLIKKVPAVEVTRPEGEGWPAEEAQAPDQAVAAEGQGNEAAQEPAPAGGNAASGIPEGIGQLQDQLKAADALVEELTNEMNSLRQQFESQNAMVPGYIIQERMDETSQRLSQALTRQAKIREKLGNRAPAPKKEPGAPDR